MNEDLEASNWAGARGEKWGTHLAGMEAMLAPVNDPLISALHLDRPCRIADIGCGGGGTAQRILHRAPPGSVVHGFDISPTLIQLARNRTRPDMRAITFQVANVSTATVPENPYDRMVSRFGVMFFDDPSAAFANLFRWLAPGGRFAFAVWSHTTDNPWLTLVSEVTAEFVDIPPADPEAPGPFRYADPEKLLALLDLAGFGDLDVRGWRGTLPIGGGLPAAEAANFAIASFSTFAELLADAGDEALDKACQTLAARFVRHQQDSEVRMDAGVRIFTGSRLE